MSLAMQVSPLHFQSLFFAILALALSGCASLNSIPASPPDASPPALQNASTPVVTTQQTPETNPSSTFTLIPTTDPSLTPLPADPVCLPGEADTYLDAVLPLADEHTVDSYQARKMETLSDKTQMTTLREKAVTRLETLRGIQPPACLQNAHLKLTESFELFIPTWDWIIAKDYTKATGTLKQCLDALAEAVAYISIAQ